MKISKSIIVYGLLFLSFLMKADHRYFYRNFFIDTEYQLAIANNWLAGNGWTAPETSWKDLSKIEYRSELIFMPGFSLAIIPFYFLFGNWLDAAFALDLLSLAMIYWGMHICFRHLFGTIYHKGYYIYLIFMGLSPAPLHYLTASGWLTLGLFLVGIGLLILTTDGKIPFAMGLTTVLGCFLATAAVRYAYLPVCLALPTTAWIVFRQTRARLDQRIAWICTVVVGICIFLAYFFISTQNYYLKETIPGWHFSHLLNIDPFPFKAFFFYGIPQELAFGTFMPGWLPVFKSIVWLISFLIICGWIYGFLPIWKERIKIKSPTRWTVWIFAVVTAGIIGMLAYLSVRTPAEDWNWIGFWTYIMETRYYAPIMMMGILWSFWLAYFSDVKFWRSFFLILTISATLAATTYPVYLKYKVHIQNDIQGTFVGGFVPYLLEKLYQHNGKETVVVASSIHPLSGEIAGVATVDINELWLQDSLMTTGPTRLIVVVAEEEVKDEKVQAWIKRFSPEERPLCKGWKTLEILIPKAGP